MIKKLSETLQIVTNNPRDGKGEIIGYEYMNNDDLENNLKGFYYNELKPNSEIGFHRHFDEDEIYYILEGTGIVKDNDIEKIVEKGDVIYTKHTEGHAMQNIGNEDLKFIAFIIKK